MTRIITYIFFITMLGFFSCKSAPKYTTSVSESGIKLMYKPKNAVYSGYKIRILPKQANYELDKKQAELMIEYLIEEFPDKEISAHLDSIISFVDCGQDFKNVSCPNCGKQISIDQWQEYMDKAYETDFKDLSFKTNCCSTTSDLNSLKYVSDCGFAKSTIEIINPEKEMNEQKILSELKKICETDLKVIYAKI